MMSLHFNILTNTYTDSQMAIGIHFKLIFNKVLQITIRSDLVHYLLMLNATDFHP